MRVSNPAAAIAAVAVLSAFALAALAGILDPTEHSDEVHWWPGVVFVLAPVAMAARGAMVGVVVTGSEVILRGWLRTRRIPRDHVLGVKTKKYSGHWNSARESRMFRMLAIKTTNGTVDVPAVAARQAKAKRLAAELRRALSLPA